ncbi:hypothetical protein GSI_12118 [Ganoderma sinense ZZ0214-1]|uniref:Uncharacterized protein n=1 Tax=Ganoderma sinense ZZ0214-1 TaxID=1077348 RepID=A0A2G8RXX7_9APHY|nr:hypothetical protein GSI_12118 [Ganoderma sinense ZZ0214-1]
MAHPQRASQIPVMTPRAPHNVSNLPSALPSPHLGLVPPSRYPSVSGSPTLSSPGSSPSPPTSGGGSTPFRTFRNFLSFGSSSKHAPSPSLPSAIPKNHFSTLGPVRRSVNVERRASSPQLVKRSEDDYVLTIDVPRPGDEKSPNTRLPKSSDPSPASRSPLSRSHSPAGESSASPTSTPAIHASELSTILEAETSGISKHLPSLDSSQTESERESDLSPNAFQPQALYPPPRNTRHGSPSPSNDTSPLDLSTSKLRSEVLAALSESGGKQDWLNGVVVDDVLSDSAIGHERTPESPDTSFNMSSLDPDLAALLSPNRVRGSSTEPAVLIAIDAIPPPASSPPISPQRNAFPTIASSRPTTSSEMQASTSTRRIPTTLSAAPRLRPSSAFLPPPITRSVSDRSGFTFAGKSGPPSPTTRTPPSRMFVFEPAISRVPRGYYSCGELDHANTRQQWKQRRTWKRGFAPHDAIAIAHCESIASTFITISRDAEQLLGHSAGISTFACSFVNWHCTEPAADPSSKPGYRTTPAYREHPDTKA